MQLICPRCHTNNRFGAERPAPARFVCVGCREEFEAVLAGGALRTVLPQDAHAVVPFVEPAPLAHAPEEEFFDILSIPQEPPAEVFAEAAPAPVLEDVFEAAPEAQEAAQAPSDAAAPAAEFDPYHAAEAAAAEVASQHAAHAQVEAEAGVAHVAEALVEAAPAKGESSSSGRVPPPPPASVDKYAVGMRVLRVSPLWLLLSSLGFFAVLLTLSWMSQPVGPVGEAVAAAGMKMPNQASSPPLKAAPAAAEEAKATAEKALTPAPQPPAKPAAEAPAPRPAAAAEKPPADAAGGKFTVQVGSFNDPSEANQRVSQLRAAGFEARSVAVELPQRGTWYRVQAGRFATREDAAKAGAQMRAKGAAAAVMVTEVN